MVLKIIFLIFLSLTIFCTLRTFLHTIWWTIFWLQDNWQIESMDGNRNASLSCGDHKSSNVEPRHLCAAYSQPWLIDCVVCVDVLVLYSQGPWLIDCFDFCVDYLNPDNWDVLAAYNQGPWLIGCYLMQVRPKHKVQWFSLEVQAKKCSQLVFSKFLKNICVTGFQSGNSNSLCKKFRIFCLEKSTWQFTVDRGWIIKCWPALL